MIYCCYGQRILSALFIHIGRIETANANLNVSTLSALCNYFNLELSAFFERVEASV